ncbi:hypothetical protein RZO07_19120 [Pseudomonas protegens]|uniref:hypothetical protein n=1 Tax=Pseudomonas protegens TaxID=380021 RepID=UPI002936FBEF|nr:hypothetical protein [Pseudomonas protegens]WOE77430.1 hypothetical protein RZO07_19120 [Pseudomonas protegens]
MAEPLGMASTLITALLGGGVSSALVTSVFAARRQERALLRNKLEELYAEFGKLARAMSDMHVAFKKYGDDEIDLASFMSEVKEISGALPVITI